MKALELNSILEKLKIEPIDERVIIKQVVTDVTKIANDTLVFNLNQIEELKIDHFKKLTNCFIISDQPLLKRDSFINNHMLFVIDIEKTYHEFITFYRGLFHFPVITITGTCGKTTTKEIIKQILEKNFTVTSTILSKNALRFNHQYLMNIDDNVNYGVFETALTHPGNIIYSCNFYRPDIGVITNIGIDHLNQCKTIDNYIKAKGEMLAGLQYRGTLIINGDDEFINKIDYSPYKGNIITFGLNQSNDFYASDLQTSKKGTKFILIHKGNKYNAYMPGFGNHNVYNALAALAVLYTLGFKFEEMIPLLKTFKHISGHLEFHKGIKDSIIVDDTWSSNPTSLKAAFEVFQGNFKKKIAVLGKIEYLGKHEQTQCKEIGKLVAESKIDYLITKDNFSKQIGIEAIRLGMDPNKIVHCPNKEKLITSLEGLIEPNTIVLFKTSMLDSSITYTIKYFINE